MFCLQTQGPFACKHRDRVPCSATLFKLISMWKSCGFFSQCARYKSNWHCKKIYRLFFLFLDKCWNVEIMSLKPPKLHIIVNLMVKISCRMEKGYRPYKRYFIFSRYPTNRCLVLTQYACYVEMTCQRVSQLRGKIVMINAEKTFDSKAKVTFYCSSL